MNAQDIAKKMRELIGDGLNTYSPTALSSGPYRTIDPSSYFIVSDPETGVRFLVKVLDEPTVSGPRRSGKMWR